MKIVPVLLAACGLLHPFVGLVLAAAPDQPLTYEADIRPIFRAHCFDCHGATEELKGGLDLRLVRSMLQGGESGPAITAGKPDESYLIDRIRSGEMPPGEHRVPDEQIVVIEQWIAGGAPTARPEPERISPGLGITQEERDFWSFLPIRRPEVRAFPAESRVRSPIDALILTAMPAGLSFSPDADRFTLIKRVYFDLTGLPPSPEEVEHWMTAADELWYEHLVDECLNSPHYGETWARHWLDVAGYADSEGYTVVDAERAWAWKYRDWVIRALNDDKPFDRFLTEQLAGDELAGPRSGDLTADQIDLLTATGFLRMAADGTGSGADNADGRNQVVTDTLRIVGTSLLGLSVQCAQCHDHRYDPIPQVDYYALRAVFEPALDWKDWKVPGQRQVSLYTEVDRQRAAEIEAEAQQIAAERQTKLDEYMAQALEKELQRYEEPLRTQLHDAYKAPGDQRTDEQKELFKKHPSININPGNLYQYIAESQPELAKYDERINAVRAKKPPEEFLRPLIEPENHAPDTFLFHRGDHQQPKQQVVPAGLAVTAPEGERPEFPVDDASLPTTGRRLAFARWLFSGTNPLVARVIANRVWMHHFGKGLVETPADFGKLGGRPTHPELLDWLASEFREQGWSLKKLHRLIMLSTAYRQRGPAGDNPAPPSAYAYKPLIRLEAEMLRDRTLAASGALSGSLFGPPVAVQEDDAGQVIVADDSRRSLYVKMRRSQPVAMLQAFDAPVMETNCESRPVSTVATQALMLMNSDFALSQATKLAARAAEDAARLDVDLPELKLTIPSPPASAWQIGYGGFDETSQRTGAFALLPHWTGSAWQGGPELPDSKLGWVTVHAKGGHPGNSREFSAIRRWVAPADGTVTVGGTLQHGNENGNGVRGLIVSSRTGLVGDWPVHNTQSETNAAELAVSAGDTIDFIADNNGDVTSDSFAWTVTVSMRSAAGGVREFSSASEFAGPPPSYDALPGRVVRAWQLALCRKPADEELRLTVGFLAGQIEYLHAHKDQLPKETSPEKQAMANLCQTLLTCNEFLYVD
ncbi:MAG: DUF1553 domain-containing protein [Planctomycetaceae bacterium]